MSYSNFKKPSQLPIPEHIPPLISGKNPDEMIPLTNTGDIVKISPKHYESFKHVNNIAANALAVGLH